MSIKLICIIKVVCILCRERKTIKFRAFWKKNHVQFTKIGIKISLTTNGATIKTKVNEINTIFWNIVRVHCLLCNCNYANCFYSAGGPIKKGRQKDYTPNMWDEYFADKKDVRINEKQVFRVYLSRSISQNGPILVLLHGGGYSALTWSHFVVIFFIFSVKINNF